MLNLLKNGIKADMRGYANSFRARANGKCAFISRDESLLENQAGKFADAIQRKTQAYFISVDMAAAAAERKTPLDAIWRAITELAREKQIDYRPDGETMKIKTVFDLCEKLNTVNSEQEKTQPIIFIRHFQRCKLTVGPENLSDYLFLREIPCKLIVTSNMHFADLELALPIKTGSSSILAPLFDSITIENDIPYKRSEWRTACGMENGSPDGICGIQNG